MKYQSALGEVLRILPTSQSILMALPANLTQDNLAAGLSLYLSLKQSGKNVSIVSPSDMTVGQSNLYGVGDVKKELSTSGSGSFVVSIGGAVDSTGTVVFDKVDYAPEGTDLKLVFPITSGKSFQPTHITPKFEGGSFDLIFVVGAQSLDQLGNLYSSNQETFNKSHIVNLDNSSSNSGFGNTKITDSEVSLSEMIFNLIGDLNLSLNQDIARNLLQGISGQIGISEDLNIGESDVTSDSPILGPTATPVADTPASGFDFTQMYQSNPIPQRQDNFTVPQVVDSGPVGTSETEVTPEEDWLTPKVFSGRQLG